MRFVGAAEEEATGPAEVSFAGSVPPQEVRFCKSPDGVNLAVATCGTGFPLVRSGTWLTHVQQDWHSPVWSPLFRFLAARFHLVRYDPRGCGLSDWQTPDISFEGFVRDLEAVVDWLGIARFALFGTSQGAAVSIAYAAHYPDRVSHLILSGGFPLGWRRRGSNAEIATREALLTLSSKVGDRTTRRFGKSSLHGSGLMSLPIRLARLMNYSGFRHRRRTLLVYSERLGKLMSLPFFHQCKRRRSCSTAEAMQLFRASKP